MRWFARQNAGILLYVGQDYHFSSVIPARLLLLLKSFPYVSLAIDLNPRWLKKKSQSTQREKTQMKGEFKFFFNTVFWL